MTRGTGGGAPPDQPAWVPALRAGAGAPRRHATPALVILESLPSVDARWHRELFAAEMVFTGLFTPEYVLRLVAARRPLAYARSALGVIDLLAIAPTAVVPFLRTRRSRRRRDALQVLRERAVVRRGG